MRHTRYLVSVYESKKAMAPSSSTLALKIPWTEKPGRLQSMGSLGVGHDWATSLSLFTSILVNCRQVLEKAMAPHSSNLAWKIPWTERSLVGCRPWGREELDMTERLHFHFSLSCIGEGNGNPLQCSCLENPRDGEAWWAAVYGVAQSRTRLKRRSSSSSSSKCMSGS